VITSIARLVEIGSRHVPAGLVSDQATSRLADIPAVLPAAFASAAFECRLHPDGGPVDFTCGLYRGRCQWALRYHWAQTPWTPRDDPAWDGAAALLGRWADTASSLHHAIDEVWLEFDLDGDGQPRPFLYLTPIDGDRHFGAGGDESVMALASECLQLLAAVPSRQTLATMRRCVQALPPAGRFLQFAPLAHRRDDTLRLVVAVPSPDVPAYLERIDWPGDADGAGEAFRSAGAEDWVSPLQLDVAETVLPPISREFCDPTSPADDGRWGKLLDELERTGACDPGRRPWLEGWSSGEAPPAFRRDAPLQVRRLLQVKVLHVPGQPLRAKAYLGFQPNVGLFRS